MLKLKTTSIHQLENGMMIRNETVMIWIVINHKKKGKRRKKKEVTQVTIKLDRRRKSKKKERLCLDSTLLY